MEKNRILGIARCALIILCMTVFTACGLLQNTSNRLLTPQEHINLGVTYENARELDSAEKEYRIASKDIPVAYLYLGNVYFQKGLFDKAEKAYRKAIDGTNDPRALNNLAWLYYTRDVKLDEAEKLAAAAVDINPGNVEFSDTLTKIREKRMIKATESPVVN